MSERLNGCHNRAPLKPSYRTSSGEVVEHVMSTDCRYRKTELGKADPGCTGCRWREEEAQS